MRKRAVRSILAVVAGMLTLSSVAPAVATEVLGFQQVNSDVSTKWGHIWPDLRANPADPEHLVVADMNRPSTATTAFFGDCMVHVSKDGGRSWTGSVLPTPEGTQCRRVAPKIGFVKDGVVALYLVGPSTDTVSTQCRLLPEYDDPIYGGKKRAACRPGVWVYGNPELDPQKSPAGNNNKEADKARASAGLSGGEQGRLILARSTDGGHSFPSFVPVPLGPSESLAQTLGGAVGVGASARSGWTAGAGQGVTIGGFARGLELATDPALDHVYVAWSGAGSHRQGVWYTRSTNGGIVFEDPQLVPVPLQMIATNFNQFGVYRMSIAVHSSRMWMAVQWLSCADQYDCLVEGAWWMTLYTVTSEDRGKTWGNHAVLARYPNWDYQGDAVPPHPGLAIDNAHPERVYVTYEEQIEGDLSKNIYLVRTTSNGRYWVPPVRITNDPYEAGFPHERSKVAVAPNGRVDIAWYDGRHDPTSPGTSCSPAPQICGGRDLYIGSSYDYGTTFTNERITTSTFEAKDRRVGPGSTPDALGSIGLVSRDDQLIAVWEHSTKTGTGTRWDLMSARVKR